MDDNMFGVFVKVTPRGIHTLFKMMKECLIHYSIHVLE